MFRGSLIEERDPRTRESEHLFEAVACSRASSSTLCMEAGLCFAICISERENKSSCDFGSKSKTIMIGLAAGGSAVSSRISMHDMRLTSRERAAATCSSNCRRCMGTLLSSVGSNCTSRGQGKMSDDVRATVQILFQSDPVVVSKNSP